MSLSGRLVIEHAKVANYLLDLEHPHGGAKAKFFTSFGFTRAQPAILMDALEKHAREQTTVMERATPFGALVVVEGELDAPDGRRPRIRAVWERREGFPFHRLVTAYPA